MVYTQEYPITLPMFGTGRMVRLNARCSPMILTLSRYLPTIFSIKQTLFFFIFHRLEQSELQIDETIFTLETYLLYQEEKLRQKR